ncbi:MAG TPA: serine/threonine protein kinase [Deltaproteobacteria bacterium]|nr:serine/threonine protein kinase [Deltaproteobacteria bacterium]
MLPPPAELPEHAPRLSNDRYVLLSRIGKGGMAGVYAAWDTHIDEWRAIKVLFPKHARDRSLRGRFETEAQTMMDLNHPNLVRVFDVGRGERLPYIVMELIHAGSLYQWSKTYGVMPPRMAVEATMQLCDGLTAVHARGVIHRDVKPRNVLINWDGFLKLTDFGIARLERSEETRTGLAMGTLGFMSPEQLHDAKSVDLRADIYAVGATLWAQLTARKARDLFRLEDKPTLLDGIPEAVRPILSRCLAYERDERFDSAVSLRDHLEAALPALPEDPPDAPPLPLPLGLPPLKGRASETFSEILTSEGPRAPSSASQADLEPSILHKLPLIPGGTSPSLIDPRPLHVRLSETEDSIPSYMVGVDQPDLRHKPELITYHGEEAPEGRSSRSRLRVLSVLSALLLVPVVAVFSIVVSFSAAVGIGVMQLNGVSSELERASVEVSDRVQVAIPIVDELVVLGVEPEPLEAALERWRLASGAERLEAAVAFIELVEAEVRPLLARGDSSHELSSAGHRLRRLEEGLAIHDEAARRWSRVAQQPQGRLAIRLRLVERPESLLGGAEPRE